MIPFESCASAILVGAKELSMVETDDLNLAGLPARIFPANGAAKVDHVINTLLSHDTPPSTWSEDLAANLQPNRTMGKRKRKVLSCNSLNFPPTV